jgi:hypothetical protein
MSIPLNKVICVSIRDCDTSLILQPYIRQKTSVVDRVIQKIFDTSSAGIRLKRRIEAKCEKFILYTSWLFAEAEVLLSSSQCLGHYYLEEGQLSYYNADTFTASPEVTFRFRQQQKELGSVNFHYRNDCFGFSGILQDAYPGMLVEKKIILENYSDALKAYTPLVKGIEDIALMPTPHRTPLSSIPSAVGLLCENMSKGGVIKLHPGYKLYPRHADAVLATLDAIGASEVKLCDDRAILELEMLIEPKRLYGARSSLAKYASSFGSTYTFIDFPSYVPPKN